MMFVMWGLGFIAFMILAIRFNMLIISIFRPVFAVILGILQGIATIITWPIRAFFHKIGRKWTWIICGALAAIALYSFIVNG